VEIKIADKFSLRFKFLPEITGVKFALAAFTGRVCLSRARVIRWPDL
jgi:hypothetical protein